MEAAQLMIDGGSSNTRFTLWKQNQIVARTRRRSGASNGAGSLEEAVRQEINSLELQWNCKITEVYASGMITSESGLAQIPHIAGPAGLDEFARAVVVRQLPEISDADFYFVPGVKFTAQVDENSDLVRGEEVEILGAIEPGTETRDRLFIHFGSHNKLLAYHGGMICRSITTLSGELLWAVWQDTILKNSLGAPELVHLEEKGVLQGYQAVQELGLTRALFSVRLLDVMEHVPLNQMQSYLYGAFFGADLQAFGPVLNKTGGEIVLYGRDEFIQTAEICLSHCPHQQAHSIVRIPHEESEWLSVRGMRRIRQRYLELHN